MTEDDLRKIVQKELQGEFDRRDFERLQIEYSQANDWARHYSTVRMTLVPGLVGLSLAILGFNWDKQNDQPQSQALWIATVIWGMAFVILWLFSALEVREQWYSRLIRVLLMKKPQDAASNRTEDGLFSLIRKIMGWLGVPGNLSQRYVGVISGDISATTSRELCRPNHWFCKDPIQDLPFWIGTVLTIIYGIKVWSWCSGH